MREPVYFKTDFSGLVFLPEEGRIPSVQNSALQSLVHLLLAADFSYQSFLASEAFRLSFGSIRCLVFTRIFHVKRVAVHVRVVLHDSGAVECQAFVGKYRSEIFVRSFTVQDFVYGPGEVWAALACQDVALLIQQIIELQNGVCRLIYSFQYKGALESLRRKRLSMVGTHVPGKMLYYLSKGTRLLVPADGIFSLGGVYVLTARNGEKYLESESGKKMVLVRTWLADHPGLIYEVLSKHTQQEVSDVVSSGITADTAVVAG